MLLVDDDQADVRQRREHRRARADAHARLPAREPLPLVVALALAERRVHAPRRRRRSAPGSARRACGVSAISGTSTIALRPAASVACDRLQVDLGLARSGHPVEQELPPVGRPRRPRSASRTARARRCCSAVSAGAPTRSPRRRGGAPAAARREPLRDRDQAPRLEPAQARGSELGGDHLAARRARERGSRWPVAQRGASPASAARPARSARPPVPRGAVTPPAAPGASTSASARAGVEQYSSAIHPASVDEVRRDRRREHGVGLGEPLGFELGAIGELDHDPQRRAARRTARAAANRPRHRA